MSSGRLIFPVIAEIRLFVPAMAQDPDFKEPALDSLDNDGLGRVASSEGPSFRLPCQVEPDEIEALSMQANGEAPRSKLSLIFHVRDAHIVRAMPKPRDRLVGLYAKRGAVLIEFPEPPGLFAVEARPVSFGLGQSSVANLLRVTFMDRSQGVRRLG